MKALEVQAAINKNMGMKHSDIKTDKSMNYVTGIPSKAAFHKLFDLVKHNIKKVNYWSEKNEIGPGIN